MTPIARYLDKRAAHAAWLPAHGSAGHDGLAGAVVIPALAEGDRLFDTLRDLACCGPALLARTLVLCVINNRAPGVARDTDIADNQRTLRALPDFAAAHTELRLAWIDAASPGRELGAREGVGLARKIGLDAALQRLHDAGRPEAPLICLDADTRVDSNYLEALYAYFEAGPRWGVAIDYAHPVDGAPETARPILSYELYLRYQELAWGYAGSPYAYPAIGSAMACTARAYAASGGMNRRQAGEDFYFLQQLAKTGGIGRLWETTVRPSGRASHRVPFGTGRKVGAFDADPDDAYRTYHPESFRVLRAWLDTACGALEEPGARLLERAAGIHPELACFLAAQALEAAWDNILRQGAATEQRLRQFHQWFDAFRTLKLVHHLRDHGFPRQDLFESIGRVAQWRGLDLHVASGAAMRDDLDAQRSLLGRLRAWRP